MAEAILTGKQVKKLSLQQGFAGFAAPFTVFPGLAKHLFMGDGPMPHRRWAPPAKTARQPGLIKELSQARGNLAHFTGILARLKYLCPFKKT